MYKQIFIVYVRYYQYYVDYYQDYVNPYNKDTYMTESTIESMIESKKERKKESKRESKEGDKGFATQNPQSLATLLTHFRKRKDKYGMSYILNNSSPIFKNSSNIVAVISILYREFVEGNYSGIIVYSPTKQESFYTGDVIRDFNDSIKFAKEFDGIIMLSSTVDNFIMDNPKYKFNQDSFTIELVEKGHKQQ